MAQTRPKPIELDGRRPAQGRGARPKPLAVPGEGPVVRQKDLRGILERRAAVAALAARLTEAKQALEEAEMPVLLAFSVTGTRVEPGPLVAAVEIDRKRHPSWKTLFVQRCGQEAADLALANSPVKESKTLVITETGTGPAGA